MTRTTTYSLKGYADMVRCEPRMSAYAEALRATITPGCTVIDLGAGPGIFSLLACRFGAGKVIAIEPDRSIELLRQFARDHGCADRIEIVHGLSSDYQGLDRADVIVSDLRGALPLFEAHVATLCDARDRLLKPGGTLIPAADRLRVAVVESPAAYANAELPWRRNDYDLDLSSAARFSLNEWARVELDAAALLGTAQDLASLDYYTLADANLRRTVVLPVERNGVAHGILVWFDACLAPGVGYSNAPGEPSQVYGQTFLPLESPLAVTAGDRLEVEVMANLIDGSYVWSWITRLVHAGDDRPSPRVRQSTFLANIIPADRLAGRSHAAVPAPRQAIDIDIYCLSLVDGERSLDAIAQRVAAKFPAVFATPAQALDRVARSIDRYHRAP